MRKLFKAIARCIGCLDEVAIAGVFAAFLLIVGPLVAALFFFRNRHYYAAALSSSLWILTAIACIRDFRRGRFSWVSATLGVLWIVTTFAILWALDSI